MSPIAPRPLARVRVPASTSNLGSGFDQLGLALSLELVVEVHPSPEPGWRVEGPPEWPAAEDDLLLRALAVGAPGLREREPDLVLRVTTEIPIARGLGSSGAAVAAGLLVGDAFAAAPRGREALLAAGVELEGHPDNVAASLFGGCTVCVPVDPPALLTVPVHASLGVALAWPDSPMPTERARAALPDRVPHADGVENARRVPLLLEGLRTGDARLLALGAEDRLHVPYRLPLLPGAAEALEAARAAGAPLATISGSGSALVAIGPRASAPAAAEAMRAALERATGTATARAVEVVAAAPAVERELL